MNQFILFATLFFFTIYKTNGQKLPSLSEKEERNKRTVLASMEALMSGDIDGVLKGADSGIVNYGNGNMPPVSGIERVRYGMVMLRAAIPIEKYEIYHVIAEGDWVFVWGRWSGVWKGNFMGQTPTGKPYSKRDVEIFKFNEEGKMIEHHSVQSMLEIATQIGLKLPEQKKAN